ncbi:MAG: hypothetical protein IJS09_04400 [Treponema sp.]|nr:hypothetical protein [Treponema sp.]
MFDVYLAELLIVSMLIILSLRIFFTKHAHIDSLAILASASFGFSLLIFYIWGAVHFIPLIILLTLLTFLLNLRSLVRLSNRLVVDFYHIHFVIPTLLLLLLAIGILSLIIIFRPVHYVINDFSVQKTKTTLTGKLYSGTHLRQSMVERSNITGVLYAYEPLATLPEQTPVVLFVPKCSAAIENYEPYFVMLAQKGYTVLTAEFNSTDRTIFHSPVLNSRFFRRFFTLCLWLLDRPAFQQALETDTAHVLKGYAELAKLAKEKYGENTPLFFVVDQIGVDGVNELIANFQQNTIGFFALNRIAEYTTPNFGFLEQTDLLAGYPMDVKRDDSFFIPRYVAGKTVVAIEQSKKLLTPVEIIKSEDTQEEQK